MGRILAVDPGLKRVGLAMSDPLKIIASPYDVIPFKSLKQLVEDLTALVKEKEVELVVIGFPIREDGEEGPGCALARSLGNKLKGQQIAFVLQDERYSSNTAAQVMRQTGHTSKSMRGKLDAVAASLILENYLKTQ